MVTKRSIGASLVLLGLAFVGIFHTIAAFAFDTGLEYVGAVLAGLCLLGVVLVNIPADEDSSEPGDETGDAAGATDESD